MKIYDYFKTAEDMSEGRIYATFTSEHDAKRRDFESLNICMCCRVSDWPDGAPVAPAAERIENEAAAAAERNAARVEFSKLDTNTRRAIDTAARLVAEGATVTAADTYYIVEHRETLRRVTIDTRHRDTLRKQLELRARAGRAVAIDSRERGHDHAAEIATARATRCAVIAAQLSDTDDQTTAAPAAAKVARAAAKVITAAALVVLSFATSPTASELTTYHATSTADALAVLSQLTAEGLPLWHVTIKTA